MFFFILLPSLTTLWELLNFEKYYLDMFTAMFSLQKNLLGRKPSEEKLLNQLDNSKV